MNIFNILKVYQTKWNLTSTRKFTQEELDAIDSAVVVASQYGTSACFFLKAGGTAFIPMSNDCTLGIGEPFNPADAELLTLSKQGEEDIMRIRI